MLRAVLDTNILVSAFTHPDGRNADLYNAARGRRFRLLISPDLIHELTRVLRRRFGWMDAEFQPEAANSPTSPS